MPRWDDFIPSFFLGSSKTKKVQPTDEELVRTEIAYMFKKGFNTSSMNVSVSQRIMERIEMDLKRCAPDHVLEWRFRGENGFKDGNIGVELEIKHKSRFVDIPEEFFNKE